MMKKKQKINLSEDLSYIDTLDDLESKIRRTKAALKLDEIELLSNFKSIPAEGIKATFGNIVPFFAKTTAAARTWNIIQTGVSLLLHNPEKKNFKGVFDKKYVQHSLKQIGIYVGLNLVRSFIEKRKNKG